MAKKNTNTVEREERRGNPVVGLTLYPEEVELIDAYQAARGLDARSKALQEMVRFAFGENEQGYSLFDELPQGGRRAIQLEQVRELQKALLKSFRVGALAI
jgi:hypothetical protein